MNFFRTKLKGLTAALALVAAVSLAGCGDDNQDQNAGIGGVPGSVINPINPVNPVGPGVSNCTTQFGQPGILVNNGISQVCMPNNQSQFPNQTFCSNYIMNNGAYMCPCNGVSTPYTGGVIVTAPGSVSCGGFQPVWIGGQYYYYVTLYYLYPSYYQNPMYRNYVWNGRTWIYVRF